MQHKSKKAFSFFNPGKEIRDLKATLDKVAESPVMALKIAAVRSISLGQFKKTKEFINSAKHQDPESFENAFDTKIKEGLKVYEHISLWEPILVPEGKLAPTERKNWAKYYMKHAFKFLNKNCVFRAFLLFEESLRYSSDMLDAINIDIPKGLQICCGSVTEAVVQKHLEQVCDVMISSQGGHCIYVVNPDVRHISDESYFLGFGEAYPNNVLYLTLAALGCRLMLNAILNKEIGNKSLENYSPLLVPTLHRFGQDEMLKDLVQRRGVVDENGSESLAMSLKSVANRLISQGNSIGVNVFIDHAVILDATIYDITLHSHINRRVEGCACNDVINIIVMPESKVVQSQRMNWTRYYQFQAIRLLKNNNILRGLLVLEESLNYSNVILHLDINIPESLQICSSNRLHGGKYLRSALDLIPSLHGEECLYVINRDVEKSIEASYLLGAGETNSKILLYLTLAALGCRKVLLAILNKDMGDDHLQNYSHLFVPILIKFGHHEILQDLIQQRGVVIDKNPNYITWADKRDANMLKLLLSHYAPFIDSERKLDDNPLIMACAGGNPESVKILLEYGANVICVSDYLMTPLVAAACSGNVDCVKLILEKLGPCVNFPNLSESELIEQMGDEKTLAKFLENEGFTEETSYKITHNFVQPRFAFLFAAQACHLEVMKVLVSYGVNPNATWTGYRETGRNALHFLCDYVNHSALLFHKMRPKSSDHPVDVAKYLLHHSKEIIHMLDGDDVSPVDSMYIDYDSPPDRIELLRFLIENGAKRSEPEKLFHALMSRDNDFSPEAVDLLKLLLERGVRPKNLEDVFIKEIKRCSDISFLEALLIAGVDVDLLFYHHETTPHRQGSWKSTALILAARMGKVDIVQLLIRYRANVNCIDENGWTALVYAAVGGFYDIVKILVQNKSNIEQSGNREFSVIIELLENYRRENKVHGTERNFLKPGSQSDIKKTNHAIALEKRLFEMISFLIQQGANIEGTDCHGDSALLIAMCEGLTDIVALLLQHHARVDQVDHRGRTVLQIALMEGLTNIVPLLFQNKANVDQADAKGQTALISACEQECKESVVVLLENKANVNLVDSLGKSALMYAASNLKIMKLLIQYNANVCLVDSQGFSALTYASQGNEIRCIEFLLTAGAIVSDKDREIWKNKYPRLLNTVGVLPALIEDSENAALSGAFVGKY